MDPRIAIVGMACRFPGGAHDPEAFWALLKDQLCTMEDVPPSRFNIEDYWSRDGSAVNKMMVRKGHFLTEGLCFDETFFNMSPRQALNTDPQHRVLLETVVDSLDDAGYRPRDEGGTWDRERMGVFIGSSVDSYQNNLATDIDAFFCPGMIRGFAAGRVSYHFQWQGPSIVYDTACSSGLVAVHAACQALLLRECDAAVAGGTNMITSPEMSIALSKGFFISQTGGCRTFDESGDGYCRAEAVGALILKRLDDALRDNDNIHAVILASGVNQSGPAESLTKPHAPSQAALFAANCARAGISPLAVRAVEAHGTGTQAGDFAEIEAIKTAFTSGRPPVTGGEEGPAKDTQLFVSALKPNVGHSESTSGIASIIKATLMMQHKEVAPHIGITTRRNPRLGDIEAHGIVIPTRSQPLTPVAGYDKIIISVNNFGAPGGNANVLLQENRLKCSSPGVDPRSYHVVTLSGKAHTPFGILVDRLLEHLDQNPSIDLASLSYTTTARRIDHPARAAFSVSSIDELKEQLKRSPSATTRKSKAAPKVGFVIGGNGSQFQGMGRTLYETSPSFKKHVEDCDAALAAAGGFGLLRVIRGELDPLAHDFESMLGASAAIFAIGYALGQLWREWGVEPSVIMGHSMGEYAGLVLAGALSLEDAMQLVVAKIKSVQTQTVKNLGGGMLALGVSSDKAQTFIDKSSCIGVEIACYNGPSQTSLSGPKAELEKVKAYVEGLDDAPLAKILPGHIAWHSSHMAVPAAKLAAAAKAIQPTAAKTPMVLNVDGSVLHPGERVKADYLAEQMVGPVRWDLCASHPVCQEVDIWIELSAKSILLPLVRPFVPTGKTFLPTLNGPSSNSWSTVTKALGRLFEAQVPINWAAYHADYPVHLVSLPRYPFARNEHYVAYQDRLNVKPRVDAAPAPIADTVTTTPLGQLRVAEPGKRYELDVGQDMVLEDYVWIAASCTGSTSIRNVQVVQHTRAGDGITIVVDGESVTFASRGTGALVASCVVKKTADVQLDANRYLLRSTEKLSRDVSASLLGAKTVAMMLRESSEDASKVVVAADGDEAIGTVRWTATPTQAGSALSSVPFTPSQLRVLLQTPRLLLHLSGTVGGAKTIAAFDFALDADLSGPRDVSVHAIADSTSADAYLYFDGRPLMRVVKYGFSNVDVNAALVLVPKEGVPMKLPITPADTPFSSVDTLYSPALKVIFKAAPIPRLPMVLELPVSPYKTLTQESMTLLLATELGIPANTIQPSDRLEDLGVDSIMSLLMRDKLSEFHGRRLKWFLWGKGMSVKDLWGHVASVAN